MTAAEAPVLIDEIAEQQSPHAVAVPAADARIYTECGSYKEAKYVGASRRREGTFAYAVYAVALNRWCVR